MTTLVITINLDNDDFQGLDDSNQINTEAVTRVLSQVTKEIDNGQKTYEGLRDINGNIVGYYTILDENLEELMED